MSDGPPRDFEATYRAGGVPWEIGRPQAEIVRLADAGLVVGSVLDVGCGTGENALHLAGQGHPVVGVDLARTAITRAAVAARDRGIDGVTFLVNDALDLGALEQVFDTALDVGCFHTLQPADRPRYAASLAAAVRPGGRAFVVCWSDRNPFGYGPERVTRGAIRATFRAGWAIESISAEVLDSRLAGGQVQAWLVRLRRTRSRPANR
jgi:SAM-dependent methyltransferase